MNKVVLITGASSEIGKNCAYLFAKKGYDLSLTYYHNKEAAIELKNAIEAKYKNKVIINYLDLNAEETIKKVFENTLSVFKKIDCLVNNAAIDNDSLFEDKTKESLINIFNINTIGPLLLSRLVINEMKKNKEGTIINVSSTNAIDTYYEYSIDYDATKAALISLTHNLSLIGKPYVRVNSVAPGWVNTNMNKNLDKDFKKNEQDKIFINRFADAKEIASVIYFLASSEASYINNEVIRVDGGCRHA